jgi:surfactin synthase thioesterase subunit
MKAFDIAKKTDHEQIGKSWYMSFFQAPFIPELAFGLAVSVDGLPAKLWNYSSEEEVNAYVSIFKEPDAREAIINWYRANRELSISYGDVSIPTILIWGNKDIAVARAGIEMTKNYMKGEYKMIELDAGHTLIQEAFPQVSLEILNHIQNYPIT